MKVSQVFNHLSYMQEVKVEKVPTPPGCVSPKELQAVEDQMDQHTHRCYLTDQGPEQKSPAFLLTWVLEKREGGGSREEGGPREKALNQNEEKCLQGYHSYPPPTTTTNN